MLKKEVAVKSRYWFCSVLVLLLLAGCQAGDKGPQGFILYQTLAEDGQPQELIIVDPDGKEQHRIPMPDLVRRGTPLPIGHKALVDTLGELYLVDAKEGSAQLLPLTEEVFPYVSQFRFSGGGERWVLLGRPRGDLTYLLNLETAQVHDVSTLGESAPGIYYGLFAPDEKHVLLRVGSDLWLIPTANLSAARRLGTGRTTFASNFSGDGKQIAYVQRVEDKSFQVVLESVDGSKSEVVATDDFIDWVFFVPGKQQLVLARSAKVTVLDLDGGAERDLLIISERVRVRRPWFAPSGKNLVLAQDTGDTITWHFVDLKSATVQPLEGLEDYQAYFWNPDHRWLVFVDDISLGTDGRRLVSLDLESGETRQVLTVARDTSYMGLNDLSSDGKFGLVVSLAEDKMMQLWLLRSAGGEPRLLAEARGVQGAFSPDGNWVAVSTWERGDDDQFKAQLMLMETQGDETKPLGAGVRPIWVRP